MKSRYTTTVSVTFDTLNLHVINGTLVLQDSQPDILSSLKAAKTKLLEAINEDRTDKRYTFVAHKYSSEFQDTDTLSPVLVQGAYLCVSVDGEWRKLSGDV